MIKTISNEVAIAFLKENHARKECVFIRNCDIWFGYFYNDKLATVAGACYAKNYVKFDGLFVKKEFRNKGIAKKLNDKRMSYFENSKIVVFARPINAGILKKYFDFIHCFTLKNGTEKLTRSPK